MNRTPLIVASMVLAIAGVAIWTGKMMDHHQPAASNIPRRATPVQAGTPAEIAVPKRQPRVVKSTTRAEDSIARLTVTASEPALQESCRKVEADARRTLGKLSDAVAMSTAQKLRVFQILVRSADDFQPSMLVAGEPVAELAESPEDAICEVLNPAQETTLLEAQIEDTAWWDDAVAQMETGLDETTPTVPEAPLTDTE